MHIPLTQDEIATFLGIAPHEVKLLWRVGRLQKTLHCSYRPIPELGFSTIYDVIEYALVAGALPVTLTREVAALWIAQLAEADEWDAFVPRSTGVKVRMMIEMAQEDGLTMLTEDSDKVAAVILGAQTQLMDICSQELETTRCA